MQSLPTTMPEEVSGWWPPEKTTKSRLKALFNRAKLEKLTKQHQVDVHHPSSSQDQSPVSSESSQVTRAANVQGPLINSTWPSRTLRISQRTGKHTRLLRVQKSLPNLFQASALPPVEAMPTVFPLSPISPPPMPQRRRPRSASRSITDSSVRTLSSLDQLRERSLSDAQSISTIYTSFSSNTNSPLHTPDSSFSSAHSCEAPLPKTSQSRIAAPSEQDNSDVYLFMRKIRRGPRPAPRCTVSTVAPINEADDDQSPQKPLPAVPSCPPQLDDKGRRISIVAPLPEPGHIRKTSARYRCSSRGATTEPITPTTPSSRPSSCRSRSSSHGSETDHNPTTSYSLFPRTPSINQAHLPQEGTPSPTSLTTSRERAMTDVRPPSRKKSSKRFGKMMPLNTSLTCAKPLTSPCSISSQEDAVKPPVPLRLARAPARQQIVRQKSMPALGGRGPPLGPPPSGPLPPLPLEASRWVSVPLGTMC